MMRSEVYCTNVLFISHHATLDVFVHVTQSVGLESRLKLHNIEDVMPILIPKGHMLRYVLMDLLT